MRIPETSDLRRIVPIIGLFFVLMGSAQSQSNHYVAPTGTNSPAYGYSPSSPWRTITYAISQASVGDTINVAPGIYHESVIINKSLTIRSIDSTTVITPLTGNGINITASNVTLQNLQVRSAPSTGIVASNVSNLTLTNVYCIRDSNSGVQLTNLTGVTVTGGSYSYNGRHGLNTTRGNNYTMSNVKAENNGYGIDSNGNEMIGSGINVVGIRGTSVVTNLVTRYNRMYGLVIGDSSTGITVNGGTYRKNGLDRGFNGAGIFIYSDVQSDSNITIQGTIIADSNATAGIWLNAQHTSCVIKNILIGQSGTTTLVNNGGAGIIMLGNIKSVTATANFTRGIGTNAAGVIVVGKSSSPPNPVPSSIQISNCTFNAGYDSLHPAITLDDGSGNNSNLPVIADGNTFAGAVTMSQVETVLHDSLDKPTLGRVYHTNDKPLPVELVSFNASTSGYSVTLVWSTATEVNNYGFNVARSQIGSGEVGTRNWTELGFVHGSGTSASPRSYSFTDGPVPGGRYMYRLKQIDRDGTFSFSDQVQVEVGLSSARPSLSQNFPNPFNPVTSIEFSIPTSGKTSLVVYNILGQTVSTLFDGRAEAGTSYRLQFDASGIPSGLYFYRLESGQMRIVRKMLLLK